MRCSWIRLCLGALAAATASLAHAATTSLVGQLDPNNAQDVVLHPFTLSAPGVVTIQSWGYGGSALAPGGVNAAGTAIAGGGFDPYVSLFAGTGAAATFVASNDDGTCPPGTLADALCGDSTLVTGVLPAGSYTLAISAFLNMSFAENLGAGTLGDGFIGLGSFGTRTNAYAVDIGGPTVAAPALLLAQVPNGLTFGPQTIGLASGPLGVQVTNVGTGPVTLGALSVGGPDAARFAAATTCTGSLSPGASCSVSVVFTPSAAGPASATVTLASNASNAPTAIAVGGTGTADAVAVASLSATDLAFGTQPIGSATVLQVQVQNTGGTNLAIGSVAFAGAAEYSFVSNDCGGANLAPGATCTVGVRFQPVSAGFRAGTLTFASNASNSPAQVAVTGSGFAPTPTSTSAQPVPALSPQMLALLAALAAGLGASYLRRRSRT